MTIKKVLAKWLTICCLTLGRIKFNEREAMKKEISRSNQVIEWKIPETKEDISRHSKFSFLGIEDIY